MMQIPQLKVKAQPALLGVQYQPTQIEMRQPKAELFIKQPAADIRYIKNEGQLTIDQTEAFADAELKHIFRRNEEWAAKGRQQAMKAVAKAVQQGDQMMKIENKGSVLPQIAKTNSEPPNFEFNIGFIPSSASKVKIQYRPGSLKFDIKENAPEIQINPNKVTVNVNPGHTRIYIKQKSAISFQIDLQK
ncbi:DUF6470 family protein [Cytobacillus spongiae]|uniref:DUF6470 family protein n=1 Tax=Cytobacillus spongiae TaxID=2901381 RepID=UPI001F168967|nr:DUF6470 family protein [Cytobacillus spongiae]UII55614.1 DUF6470 family protein [Cytobacillus spongiae]